MSDQDDGAKSSDKRGESGNSTNESSEQVDKGGQELLDEHLSESSKCAECGEPVDNLRKTCPHCGHEYEADEQDDDEAGNEFKAGLALDEDGNEITDESILEG